MSHLTSLLRPAPWALPMLSAQAALPHALKACPSMGRAQRCSVVTAAVQRRCNNITWQEGAVTREAKERLLNQRGCVLWFTGLSGSGKSTVACTLEHALVSRGILTTLLDGDNVRHGLNCNLGFSAEDREENVRRIGEVAKLMTEAGLVTLASFISPYRADRDRVRARQKPNDFIEIYMKVPLEVCEKRDCKGLYKLARAGKIKGFTGVDDPYEAPENPEIVLDARDANGHFNSPEEMAAKIIDYLEVHGYLRAPLVNNAVNAPVRLAHLLAVPSE